MIIRKIKESEIDFLEEMLYEALFVEKGQPPLPESIVFDPSLSKYTEAFGSNKFDLCLVAAKNGKPVGAAWGRCFSAENPGYGFLDTETPELSIALKEQFRNQGIGAQLIKELIELYQKMQVKSISLSVDKKNPALRLYKRIGFNVQKETEKSVVMQYTIK